MNDRRLLGGWIEGQNLAMSSVIIKLASPKTIYGSNHSAALISIYSSLPIDANVLFRNEPNRKLASSFGGDNVFRAWMAAMWKSQLSAAKLDRNAKDTSVMESCSCSSRDNDKIVSIVSTVSELAPILRPQPFVYVLSHE